MRARLQNPSSTNRPEHRPKTASKSGEALLQRRHDLRVEVVANTTRGPGLHFSRHAEGLTEAYCSCHVHNFACIFLCAYVSTYLRIVSMYVCLYVPMFIFVLVYVCNRFCFAHLLSFSRCNGSVEFANKVCQLGSLPSL